MLSSENYMIAFCQLYYGASCAMQGIADSLFDENAVTQTARPGTSFNRPMTSAAGKVDSSEMLYILNITGLSELF